MDSTGRLEILGSDVVELAVGTIQNTKAASGLSVVGELSVTSDMSRKVTQAGRERVEVVSATRFAKA